MPSSYALELRSPLGDVLIKTITQFEQLEWSLRLNDYGHVTVTFGSEQFARALYAKDRRLDVWRTDDAGATRLIESYWLRNAVRYVDGAGHEKVMLRGMGRNQLLGRRIIEGYTGSPDATKTGPADDIVKEYVSEALGPGAAAARDWTANGLTIAADLGAAPTVNAEASRRKLLTVLQEVAGASAEKGTPLYFGIEWVTNTSMEFRTRTALWGADRRETMTPFSLLRGTLADAMLDEDARDEITHVYVAGQGVSEFRWVIEVDDGTRSAETPWGRIEELVDGRSSMLTVALEDYGTRALEEGRPVFRFDATLEDRPNARFGTDWGLGDMIQAEFGPEIYDCMIEAVQGRADGAGEEISARLEAT